MATRNNKNVDVNFEGAGIDDHWSFSPDSIVGLQWDFRVTDNMSTTVQLVSKGSDNFSLDAEWMYLTYEISDQWQFKAGRMRNPLYHFSETLEVGFLYPWVRPPLDVYLPDVTSFEGISFYHRLNAGGWFFGTRLFGGSIDEEITKVRELAGLLFEVNNDPWSFRFLYGKSNKLIVRAFEATEEPTSIDYWVHSTVYDDGKWQITFEVADLVPSSDSVVVGNTTGFISITRRIGDFEPYFIAGAGDSNKYTDQDKADSESPIFTTNLINSSYHQRSYSLGLRYNINAATSFKIDASHFFDIDENQDSRFDVANDAQIRDASKVAELGDSATLLTLGIDLVF